MRGLLGGIILVGGVGGLGWYATQGPAAAMQGQIAGAAADIAAGAQHNVAVAVSGRDVTVSGVVEDDAELTGLVAAFDAISGRRVINIDAVTALPVVSPYTLAATKEGDALSVTGFVPSQDAKDALGHDALDIANGEPDDAWSDAGAVAIAALDTLKSGALDMSDTALTFTGLAASPAALASFNDQISQLPAGYTATSAIDVEDDGTPLRLSLSYDGASLSGSGKIPADFGLSAIAVDGATNALDVQEAMIGSADGLWPQAAQAGIAALAALEDGTLDISDQTVTLTGTATPEGIDAATVALAALPEGYSAQTDLVIFDDGAPFSLMVTKSADGVSVDGKLPADFESDMAAGLLDGAVLDDLAVAFTTDPQGVWPEIAQAGFTALAALEDGTLTITEEFLALSGNALSPDARAQALTALEGYANVSAQISLLDDGMPVTLLLNYDSTTGVQLAGKLPANISVADVAGALDLDVADVGAAQSALRSDVDFLGPLQTLRTYLPELSGLSYAATADNVDVAGVAMPGVDPAQLAAAMQEGLGDGVTVFVGPATNLPSTGTTRINRFSGREEVFTSGYWLPTFDFFATPENCAAQSDIVLGADQVQFVTGSADLDVTSIRAINALAALARKCALEGGVFLQVAGHTDNTGDPDANLALSQARADAVREAILDRGVAQSVVSAVGYGDTQPIADNETEEGRAANRRTAFNWNFE